MVTPGGQIPKFWPNFANIWVFVTRGDYIWIFNENNHKTGFICPKLTNFDVLHYKLDGKLQ